MSTIPERLNDLRAEMRKADVDAWFISGTDPHSGEYLPDKWKTREFISGFTGSYGVVVVTHMEAGLWTDTRYFIQATEQLQDTGIVMYKLRVPDAVSPEEWITANLPSGSRVGIDAQTISVSAYRNLQSKLFEKNIELVQTPDLLGNIWNERPDSPEGKIFELDVSNTGYSRDEKRDIIIKELISKKADLHLFTMLDEIAWLFNLRGSDIAYNPVFTGFGLQGEGMNCLFVEESKFPADLKEKLNKEGVETYNYSVFYKFLEQIEGRKIFLDPATCNHEIYERIREKNILEEGTSIVSLLKARKNKAELKGFRKAMQKDGAALIKFLYWLKNNLGKKRITEYTAGRKLMDFRSDQPGFKGESFPPIVGYREHGAIVHLSAGEDDALDIEKEGILLFDSGGQYCEGTTDITRTIGLGKVSDQQRKDYTLVLKGMIALSAAIFPKGTKGCHLDILAREALWQNGMNYGHGTGHGIGHFLNVHEGPMSIRQEYNEHSLEPGMVLSNEPAFYREGEYGIRTENMIACKEGRKTEFGEFLEFETLTLCPIDTSLIDFGLFNEKEKNWLNQYHKEVNTRLKPLLEEKYHSFLDDLTRAV